MSLQAPSLGDTHQSSESTTTAARQPKKSLPRQPRSKSAPPSASGSTRTFASHPEAAGLRVDGHFHGLYELSEFLKELRLVFRLAELVEVAAKGLAAGTDEVVCSASFAESVYLVQKRPLLPEKKEDLQRRHVGEDEL